MTRFLALVLIALVAQCGAHLLTDVDEPTGKRIDGGMSEANGSSNISRRNSRGGGGGRSDVGGSCTAGAGEVGTLDEHETKEILFMREEEKLARDVYLTMLEKYGSSITTTFEDIAVSEQEHMDSMLKMIYLYGLEDPVDPDTVGLFHDPFLAELYTDLVARGETSLLEALKVGTFIEETDAIDLVNAIENTDEEVLACVYDNLLKASYEHLKAFVRAIEAQGETYTPVLLDAETVAEILGN